MATRYLHRIVIDPDILTGKPVIRGTRIPVEQVLHDLSENLDVDVLIEAYPRLSIDDIRACLEYAQAVIEGEIVFPAIEEPTSHNTA